MDVNAFWNMYLAQGNPDTFVARAFWHPQNILALVDSITKELEKRSGLQISFVMDYPFFSACVTLSKGVANTTYVKEALDILNANVMDYVVQDRMLAIRRQKLYYKYFIFNDREMFLPPPEDTLGRRRVIKPSSEAYYLQAPYRRFWSDFQQGVQKQKNYLAVQPLFAYAMK